MTFKLNRFSPINICCLWWWHSGDDMMLPEIEVFFIQIIHIHILLQWKCSEYGSWIHIHVLFLDDEHDVFFFFLLFLNKYLMAWYIYGLNNSLWNVHKFSGRQCFIGKQEKNHNQLFSYCKHRTIRITLQNL